MTKVYVLSSEGNVVSASKLGHPVITHTCQMERTTGCRDHGTTEGPDSQTVLIRWGVSQTCENTPPALLSRCINRADRIAINRNKMRASMLIGSVCNVPTQYRRRIPSNVEAVVRPEAHEAGREFQIQRGPRDIPEGYYASERIDNSREYRVWVVGDKTLVAKRIPRPSAGLTQDNPCHAQWGYHTVSDQTAPKLREEAVKAVQVMGLDFGAVDACWVAAEREYYVFEVNTAPALDLPVVADFMKYRIKDLVEALAGV